MSMVPEDLDMSESIKLNYLEVIANIKQAAAKSQWNNQQVKLVAVTKTVSIENIKNLLACGVDQVAENRVQEILAKQPELPQGLHWHLIGHLQTNKVKHIIDKVDLIHSLDRLDLAKEIEKKAQAINKIVPCLIQVNIADDDSKFGLSAAEVWDFCTEIVNYPHIQIKGLMTIGPFLPYEQREEMRQVFADLRKLKDVIAQKAVEKGLHGLEMQELSMGMSGDYDIAVEEGATMVRVGSKLFGARVYR